MKPNQNILKIIYSITFLCIAIVGTVHAQIPYKKTQEEIDLNDFKGSMYINDKFVKSIVYDGLTKKNKTLYLRYDAYRDIFEKKPTPNEVSHDYLKQSSVVDVTYGDTAFYYRKYYTKSGATTWGYLEKICQIGDQVFYKKYGKEVIMPIKAATSYEQDKPGKIKDRAYYVTGVATNLKANIITKKTILNHIPATHTKEIKAYIKESKLKFKKQKDFIKLAEYCLALGL